MWEYTHTDELYHFGTKGQRWGFRRYQNPDGSLTTAGRARYKKLRDRSAYNKTSADSYSYRAAKARRRGKTEKADKLDVKARKLYKRSTRDQHKADRLENARTEVTTKKINSVKKDYKNAIGSVNKQLKGVSRSLKDLEKNDINNKVVKKEINTYKELRDSLNNDKKALQKGLNDLKKIDPSRYSMNDIDDIINKDKTLKSYKN